MALFGADVNEVNRIFYNVFQKIEEINQRLDSLEAQLDITCFNITVMCNYWPRAMDKEITIDYNSQTNFSAIYLAGQFIFIRDNTIAPKQGFEHDFMWDVEDDVEGNTNRKYRLQVLANQQEIELTLERKEGESNSRIGEMAGWDYERCYMSIFPIRKFIEASDAQKHLLYLGDFRLNKNEDFYKPPHWYQFQSDFFTILLHKSQPERNLNTNYHHAMIERWREMQENPELYQEND